MTISNRFLAASVSIVLMTGAGLATAQTTKANCMNAGPNIPEPLGDREGHAVQVSAGTCLNEGGLLDGTVTTQNTIWEMDKGALNILSADGVSRKPGTTVAYRVTSGALTFVMKDGKPAGWTAAGKGTYTMATGSAAALAGKNFSWTGYATGPRSYVLETKVD
jgi:hypothetical protein